MSVPPPTAAQPPALTVPLLLGPLLAAAMKGMKLPKKGNMDINPRNMQVRRSGVLPPVCNRALCSGSDRVHCRLGCRLMLLAVNRGSVPRRSVQWKLAASPFAPDTCTCAACPPAGPPPPTVPRPALLQQSIAQMSRMLPPHMLKMMGGPAALQSLVKQMEGKL